MSAAGFCLAHDPERADQMTAAREAGKAAKRAAREPKAPVVPAAPQTLEDAVQWSSWAMHAVATGQIDARTGHEIGYLVNAFKGALEKRDMQKELDQLRADLEAAKRIRRA